MSTVTEQSCARVLAALKAAYEPWASDGEGPVLITDWDGYDAVIVWEGGAPYDWPFLFPYGGIEEEYGFRIPDVSDQMPTGFHVEAVNHLTVAIYAD